MDMTDTDAPSPARGAGAQWPQVGAWLVVPSS